VIRFKCPAISKGEHVGQEDNEERRAIDEKYGDTFHKTTESIPLNRMRGITVSQRAESLKGPRHLCDSLGAQKKEGLNGMNSRTAASIKEVDPE